MKKQRRQRKNCPVCIYLNSKNGACTKNPEKNTYSIHTLPEDQKEREWCQDMKKRKK